jgi:uncharacterized protein YkwD
VLARILVAAVLVAVSGSGLAATTDAPPLEMRSFADRVFLELDEARRAENRPAWTRMPELDALAAEAAERASRDPWAEVGSDISEALRASKAVNFRRIVPLVQTQSGHDDPVQAAVDQWRDYSGAWNSLMDPSLLAIGIADTVTSDGATVLVAILVEHLVPPDDLRALERDMVEAVNRIRAGRKLPPLIDRPDLAVVARKHSRDMATRNYFSHESPEGFDVSHRVLVAGILYKAVAENLLQSRGADDPVAEAVDQWMKSGGHRKNIVDPEFTETGVGIEINEDGKLYFTQVFIDPRGKRDRAPHEE